MPTRDKIAIARAVHRLNRERLIPVHVIAAELGLVSQVLQRWIVNGRRGVFLDGLKRDGTWMTSREAFERFEEWSDSATASTESVTTQQPTQE